MCLPRDGARALAHVFCTRACPFALITRLNEDLECLLYTSSQHTRELDGSTCWLNQLFYTFSCCGTQICP